MKLALLELVETNDDPKIKSEADKNLQSKDMCINMTIEQFKCLLSFF